MTDKITALKELVGRMTPGPKSERRVAEVLRAGVGHTFPRPYQPVDFDADAHGIVSADRVLHFLADDGCVETMARAVAASEGWEEVDHRWPAYADYAHAIRTRLCEIALGTEGE